MHLVGFGASSMAGAGDSQGGFFRRAEPDLRALRPDWEFANRGIGGNTTRGMLARHSEVTAYGEYDLIVMLGCNDVPRANDSHPDARTNQAEYKRNLGALLPAIRGQFSLFISSFPVCSTRTGVESDLLTDYMTAAIQIAAESGYAVWDLYRELRDTDVSPYWAADGLHFNDIGHAMTAARLVERLASQNSPS